MLVRNQKEEEEEGAKERMMMMREEKEETMVMIATILIFSDWRINLPRLHLPYQGRVAHLLPTLILSITLKTAHLAASVVFFVVASTLKFNKYRTMKRKRRRRERKRRKISVRDGVALLCNDQQRCVLSLADGAKTVLLPLLLQLLLLQLQLWEAM